MESHEAGFPPFQYSSEIPLGFPYWISARLSVEGSSNLFYVSAVTANSFMKLIAGNAKLFRPVRDVGCHLGIDHLRIVWSFYVLFMYCVGFVCFRCIVMF